MRKPIYILGGMGPQASVELYRILINKAQRSYGAVKNDDFPEIVIHSLPVPDFISDESQKDRALQMLARRVQSIDKEHFGMFAIACNTAHILAPKFHIQTSANFVSMIDETIKRIAKQNYKTVGLLAGPTTIKSKLYANPLSQIGTEVIVPTDIQQNTIESVIRTVLAGKTSDSDCKKLHVISASLQERGAEAILLGCTELPLIYSFGSLPSYSSLHILADKLLKLYYTKEEI